MSKVDDALEWADQVADNAPGETHEAILAAEVRRLRAMLEPTPDARELAEEIQNIKWLIDEGPAHEKLTEAQVRLSAVKEKIVARNNILTNDSYNLTTVLYNHMTRGPWKHIPPEFYEIEERKAEAARLIAAHDARLRAMSGDLFGEIFERLCPAGWDKDDWVHECFSIMQDIAPESAAHDARLPDEAAERAEEWRVNLGPGDDEASTLRAAIKGALDGR